MKRVVSVLMAVVMAGCSGVPRGSDRAPDEFALSLTILGTGLGQSAAMQPAWYVVEADGVLRVAVGERLRESGIPPRVRHLGRADMDRLWSEVQAWRGWPAATGGDRPEATIGPTALAYVAWGGEERRSYRIDLARPGATGESVERTVGVLRDLAWMK